MIAYALFFASGIAAGIAFMLVVRQLQRPPVLIPNNAYLDQQAFRNN